VSKIPDEPYSLIGKAPFSLSLIAPIFSLFAIIRHDFLIIAEFFAELPSFFEFFVDFIAQVSKIPESPKTLTSKTPFYLSIIAPNCS
jgi:hypothetical protein